MEQTSELTLTKLCLESLLRFAYIPKHLTFYNFHYSSLYQIYVQVKVYVYVSPD